ncbi:hypothetical protein ACE6H2_014501 [Prunus campanulata]
MVGVGMGVGKPQPTSQKIRDKAIYIHDPQFFFLYFIQNWEANQIFNQSLPNIHLHTEKAKDGKYQNCKENRGYSKKKKKEEETC